MNSHFRRTASREIVDPAGFPLWRNHVVVDRARWLANKKNSPSSIRICNRGSILGGSPITSQKLASRPVLKLDYRADFEFISADAGIFRIPESPNLYRDSWTLELTHLVLSDFVSLITYGCSIHVRNYRILPIVAWQSVLITLLSFDFIRAGVLTWYILFFLILNSRQLNSLG